MNVNKNWCGCVKERTKRQSGRREGILKSSGREDDQNTSYACMTNNKPLALYNQHALIRRREKKREVERKCQFICCNTSLQKNPCDLI
jgi:hypothetical protein